MGERLANVSLRHAVGTWGKLGVRGGTWGYVEVRGGTWGVRGGTWGYVGVRGGTWGYVGVRGGTWGYVGVRGGTWGYVGVRSNGFEKGGQSSGRVVPEAPLLYYCRRPFYTTAEGEVITSSYSLREYEVNMSL